jgi:hypothetical protein
MKKKIFLLFIVASCGAVQMFSQPANADRNMNVQEAALKAIQLDAEIAGKKTAAEKEKIQKFKAADDEFKAASDKLSKLKKDEFETTAEFNSRIEAERLKLSAKAQEQKDNYVETVYNVEKNENIPKLEKQLEEITSKSYKLPNGFYKVTVNKYNADDRYFDVSFDYYVRTVVDPKTQKKTPVWDKASLKWEIERDQAKELSPRKEKLAMECWASLFKTGGTYVFDRYEIFILDPDTKDVLFTTVFFQNKQLNAQPAVNAPSGGVFVISIAASSFLTEKKDRNAYQPVKAFDGKKDTAWTEKAPGPGIGEWIEIKFSSPVTADRILVSPGLFDTRYWIKNNRVRVMTVQLDDYTQEVVFKDQMVPQEVVLSGGQTFSRARFIIKDVYQTSQDDDTCVAEIEFYNAKKKIALDLSAFAEQLKVVPE